MSLVRFLDFSSFVIRVRETMRTDGSCHGIWQQLMYYEHVWQQKPVDVLILHVAFVIALSATHFKLIFLVVSSWKDEALRVPDDSSWVTVTATHVWVFLAHSLLKQVAVFQSRILLVPQATTTRAVYYVNTSTDRYLVALVSIYFDTKSTVFCWIK